MDTIITKLYEQVHKTPQESVLFDQGTEITYAILLDKIHHIRDKLSHQGVQPGDKIAICADNSTEFVIAVFAVMDLGCIFVPLSPHDPQARIVSILNKLCPAVTLIQKRAPYFQDFHPIVLSDLLADDVDEMMVNRPHYHAPLPRKSSDLAYIIFTSGSTGVPKGVCISQGSFYSAVAAAAKSIGFSSSSRALAILPFHFDGSFSSLFPPILCGASVFVNNGPLCLLSKFGAICEKYEITHTTITPTYLNNLVRSSAWEKFEFSSIKCLCLGGEASAKSTLKILRDKYPNIKIFNRYGPTEATMAVSTFEITDEIINSNRTIPIGKPNNGVEFRAVNSKGESIATGERGELYIGGKQLMSGYLDDSYATNEVLADFFGDGRNYLKSGDIVTIDQFGSYIYCDRSDNIVKRNGTRISLAEIENALESMNGLVASAVCVKRVVNGTTEIAAYVQPKHSDVDERQIRQKLLKVLPAAMNPDMIFFQSEISKTSSGKADRKSLQASFYEFHGEQGSA